MIGRRTALLAGLAAACATRAQAADAEVTIDNFVFTPATLTVAPGTRVVWTNRDDIPHIVADAVQQPPAYKSPALDTEEVFARVFDKPGIYGYFCSLHPHMKGTVIVQ
jgi:plastocyanin